MISRVITKIIEITHNFRTSKEKAIELHKKEGKEVEKKNQGISR